MRRKLALLLMLSIGIAIGAGLPQGSAKLVFQKVLADCEEAFTSLTVSGDANLQGNVTVAAGPQQEDGSYPPVDSVLMTGSSITTQVSGLGMSVYDQGFGTMYGDLLNGNGAAVMGVPKINATDVTNYYMGQISTGVILNMGDTGGVSVGDYNNATPGADEFSTPTQFTGACLAGLDTDSNMKAAAHLKTSGEAGQAYLGALQSDGGESSIQIDAQGNIVINLGDDTQQAPQPSQQTMQRNTNSQQSVSSATSSVSPSGELGGKMPLPDVSYFLSQYGNSQGAKK